MDSTTTQHALVAIFSDRASAQSAVQELMRNGFQSSQVEINSTDNIPGQAASGNAGLSGNYQESSGGGLSSWFHSLFGSDDHDDDDRNYYSKAASRGRAAVVVHAQDDMLDRAADILNRSGAINVEDSDTSSTSTSTSQTRRASGNMGSGNINGENTGTTEAIPVVQEELQVGKRAVQRGAVRVYSRVMQQPVEEQVSLREERVRVDRRAVDRPATDADLAAADRDVIEVTETVEEPVVSKRSRVVEEVTVGKEVNERTETVRDNVRRSEVNVEDSRGNRQTGGTRTADFDEDYRSDFQTRFGSNANYRYEDYAPAYNYGYQMASDPRYKGRNFDEVSDQMKTDYLRNNPNSTWDNTKGAVRYGWEKMTGQRSGSSSGTTDFDDDYRNDFRTRYGYDQNQQYEQYAPAYQYGYKMASDPRYKGRNFDEVNDQLRTDYLRNNPNSTWDNMKGAVRYGWEKMTGQR